ncbi:hypothetical protein MuYL_4266 [Mucilaginibacter xinganensis]|uniref:Uncharacterized protein n=1 Tax=Mucilaginibacter xinganensis TaxID=1234841 RepID=A0A223P2V4_9SPHI|nr:hypothetical protein MuYL_4266 [Mucilaginibacter xinganensis]
MYKHLIINRKIFHLKIFMNLKKTFFFLYLYNNYKIWNGVWIQNQT